MAALGFAFTEVRAMRRGFSGIELAVVLIIIVILALMLTPSFERGREYAIKTKCLSQVRQVGMAIEMYQTAHSDYWPWARRSVRADHPEWPDPTASLAALYPDYAPKPYLFRCPATDDIVGFAPDNKDFLNCRNFYVSPTGKVTRKEDEGKKPPCPPSYFYDAGGRRRAGIPRDALPSRVIYGDDCVHGYWKNEAGKGFWLGRNNHPLDGGNFLFVDKHVEWLDVRWSGIPWQMGKSAPTVPNFAMRIRPTDPHAPPFVTYPDSNVFADDWGGQRAEADAYLSGMTWVGDSWMEF
jgi:type II secretory pathway pseudopilin PulG